MAQKTDLNVSPYYDDYSDSKNFHRVLFKPSVAIQARELTQLQSILQNQIERFGNHVFKEGSIITGARTTYDDKFFAVKVNDTNPNGSGTSATESFRADSLDKIFQGETTGVVAKVVDTAAKTTSDPLTLFVKYLRTGNSGTTFYNEFQDAEEISRVTANATTGEYTTASDNNEFKVFSQSGLTDVGSVQGSAVSIAEGIMYVRGNFVKVNKQTLILEKYSATPSYKIGLDVAETLVDSTTDTSLLDNAIGSTNENAPGANRLKITLTLAKKSLTATDSTNFIELMRVESGIVTRKTQMTEYARLQDSLAQRTYDESGDYTLQPFSVSFREHYNNQTNNGVYSSTDTPAGDKTKFIANVSAGRAYVKGYQVNKSSQSFVTLDKARTTDSKTGVESPFRLGNYIKVENMYGSPDIGNEGSLNPMNEVLLYDTALGSSGAGDGGGSAIGVARVRNIDNDGTNYRVYLFDVQMFTKITNTGTVSMTGGSKIKGSSSNAIGTVYSQSGAVVNCINVTGIFQAGETITRQDDDTVTATISSTTPRNYGLQRARRIHQTAANQGGSKAFGGDLVLDDNVSLTGTAYIGSGDLDALVGVGSKFTNQLEEGDKILFPDGQTGIVNSIASDTSVDLTADLASAIDGTIIRTRPKLYKSNQTVAISGLPQDGISNCTTTREVVRRQGLVTVADSKLTLSAASGETFTAKSVEDYVITNEDTGAVVPVSATTFSGAGTASLEISGGAVPANDKVCKVLYTVVRDNTAAAAATKTMKRSTVINVNTADPAIFGLGYQHEDISLGITDLYKVRAIYQGGSTVSYGSTPTESTEALPPSFVYTADEGNSVAISAAGTLLKGSVSGARGILIENSGGTCFFYYITDKRFQNSEEITTELGSVGTCASVSIGSPEIKNSFLVDDGQRDGYYGLASITRKQQAPTPAGKLKIIVDYFTHGAGNYFTHNSYTDMMFEEMPHYVADRIDPNATFEPSGTFRLRDAIDYRPAVAPELTVSSTTYNAVISATPPDVSALGVYPFAYSTQAFDSGAHTVDLHKIGANTTSNVTNYLNRIDKLFLTSKGDFIVSKGESSLSPVAGGDIEDAILIGTVKIPAYTTHAEDVSIKLKNHRRYTMRDIDRMSKRLTILENAVTMSMLETTTDSLQVLDDDGFDKFKSGFIVDAFKGHGVGNPSHPDYQVAMDGAMNVARPTGYTGRVGLSANTDKSNNIVINDNIVTLKFDSDAYLQATKASTELNVNPFNIANFIGNLTLDPDADQWHERTQMPDVLTSVEGNFDAIQSVAGVGTVWNEWQETSQGIPVTTQENVVTETLPIETIERVGGRRGGRWIGAMQANQLMGFEFQPRWDEVDFIADNWDGGGRINSEGTAGTRTTFTEVTTTPTVEQRSGVNTQVVEDIVRTENDRLVKMDAIPFMRSIDITATAENMKPNSKLNVYFDGIQVNSHCTPSSATYGVGGATTKGTQVLTDGHGKALFTFTIPNNNPSFSTGTRTMKLTNGDSIDDAKSTTSAEATFSAQGTMAHHQKTITSTRNARVVQTNVSESRDGSIVTREDKQTETEGTPRIVWIDPLAQSFLVTDTNEEGAFLTKIDLYFSTRDATGLPVTVDIREMENGYPTQRIVPGSEVTKNPDDVNVSSNGQTATTFEFKHPIYVQPNREYCFVVTSNSNEYFCWTGEMGKFDVHTQEPIDEQPYAGVLFKSQNSSTWTTEEMQDLKFTIYRAKFVSSGTLTLENDKYGEVSGYAQSSTTATDESTSQNFSSQKWINPIEIVGTGDGNRFKVHQLSHGMYDTDSNVVIEGVVGDRLSGLTNISIAAYGGSAAGSAATYTDVALYDNSTGAVTDATADIVVDSASTASSIKINNPGSGLATTQTLKLLNSGAGGSGTATFCTITINAVGDTLGGMPISLINATHENIASFDMDSYEIDVNLNLGSGSDKSVGGIENVRGGGTAVRASRNLYYDSIHPSIRHLTMPKTSITPNLFTTSANSPQGSASAYSKATASAVVVIDDNNPMASPKMIPSFINEYEEMGNVRGCQLDLNMTSSSNITGETTYTSRVSPVVDLNSAGIIGTMNRVNFVDSASDIATNSTYIAPEVAEGDSNNAVYITKRVNLENAATELKIMFDGYRPVTTDGDCEILTYYKVQNQDDSTPFSSKGWIQFDTTNVPDADSSRFRTYDYSVLNLDEFTGFAIKIVLKSKQTSRVPVIRQFRGLALA